ncbi:serine protease [uncultured Alistipes sp.]|jgi:hypothetical protein|uniref:serine protease n=1 Tax=uncultured Alistipes sp. TaxID=538949 RepID=UPI0025D08588|nr:serine protease [uncultured Alistipes sp.]
MEQNNTIYNAVFRVNHSEGSGSCFYLKSCNLFVTNYHVVAGFRQVAIRDNNHNTYLAQVVLVNPQADIALLRAEGDFSAIPEITIPESSEVSIGHRIIVAGYPFGMPFTATEGTVSSPKQLINGKYYIQTDAAVNPGNSGGPMLNDRNELIAVTVSKLTNADNMGFGIPVSTLREVLAAAESIDNSDFHLQCPSCEELIAEEQEYCPSCGESLPENIFKERTLTDLAAICERTIEAMGVNPLLARMGNESWVFHKGSSEIRLFVYNRSYLFCTSPINLLPKKDLEPILTYLVSEDMSPYKMGIEGNQIYIAYRIHISDLFSEQQEQVMQNFVNLAHKADELDNMLVEKFGCEFSEYTKKDAI